MTIDAERLDPLLVVALDIPRWRDALLAGAPYPDDVAVRAAALALASPFTPGELDRALAHHPRIGERAAGPSAEARFSRMEQSAAESSDPALASAIEQGNREYEARFGRVFLIRAAGRDRGEILAELVRRLALDDAAEREEVEQQLREIAALRLTTALEDDRA